jgi:hypothetical protein
MFIQVIQGKVADADGLPAAIDRWGRDLQPGATGWLGTTGGITDDDTFVATVRSTPRKLPAGTVNARNRAPGGPRRRSVSTDR